MPAIPKYLEPQQVEALIGATTTARDKALLAVIYQFGLRRGEVELLDRDDFRPHSGRHGVLRVKRLKKDGLHTQEEPLWGRTARLVSAYLDSRVDHEPWLFLSNKGGAMTGQAVYYVFRGAAERAGLPEGLRHPHALRHSCGTHHANMGADFADIQNLLSHERVDTTMVYAQVLTPRKRRRALESEHSPHFARF